MRRVNRTKAMLITGMIFAIIISHMPAIYTSFYHELTSVPTVEEGVINISGISPNRNIVLDGKWEFYWNQLLVSKAQQKLSPHILIPVPDYWSRYKFNGSYLPAEGFASYRLTLNSFSYARPITIYMPDFGSAYRVYIDRKLTAESGVVSENSSEVFTTTNAKLYPVMLSEGQEHEVIIEVATTRFSGLYMAPILKDYNSTVQQEASQNNFRMILFGITLFAFLVQIVVYILSFREGKRTVWVPVMGMLVLVRIMMTTEFYSFWQNIIFFNLSYESTNPFMFFISFTFKYLLIFLIEELLGIAFSKKEKQIFLIYYAVLFLLYLFIPHGFYNRHLTILLPVCAFAMELYSFFKVYHNWQKMKKYGLLVYWGTVLAITGLIMDCYYINGNLYINLSMSLLVLLSVFMMILSTVSAMRMADVYSDFAVSSARLTQARVQIAMQTEYYEALSAQINDVRALRHDIHHIIEVIRRLSVEKQYEELNNFLNQYVEKADTSPLPVFCENIVANSILGYYSMRLKEHDITFRCTCQIPKQLSVSDSDICVVLGNALENAMEACEKLASPEARYIVAEARKMNDQFLIKVTNAYNGVVNQQDGNYISAKEGGFHGLGLNNIKKVVNTYGGFVKTEHSGRVFTLMVAFKEKCEVFF